MSKQWKLVLIAVAGMALGAWGLVKLTQGIEPVAPGARAPDFRVVDVRSGDSVSLRERYQGSVTLVNIWATWCVPCRAEMPSMQRLYEAYGSRGFKIAAVSIDEEGPEVVLDFANELGLTFDILHDRTTRIQQSYQTTGVPESFLVDRRGVIVHRVIGAHDWGSERNRALVERLLADEQS
ncbi:MAG TPA: TlpA disulfide reductase family protein [Gemmatimonadales bacterium]|nr:TlpA disulfide reductase family protein [Gemmatimonadales bacterium]